MSVLRQQPSMKFAMIGEGKLQRHSCNLTAEQRHFFLVSLHKKNHFEHDQTRCFAGK